MVCILLSKEWSLLPPSPWLAEVLLPQNWFPGGVLYSYILYTPTWQKLIPCTPLQALITRQNTKYAVFQSNPSLGATKISAGAIT